MKTIACNPNEMCSPSKNKLSLRLKWRLFWTNLIIIGAEDLSKIK